MVCNKCGKDNRKEAKYCRFCGTEFSRASVPGELICKAGILPELEKLEDKLKVAGIIAEGGARIGMDCLILGDSGSGKNFIANMIADKMLSSGVVKKKPMAVDASDWDKFSSDFDKNISSIKDGILLITNAHKLLPTSKASNVNQLDRLFNRMRSTEGAPVVLLCGLLNELSVFMEYNKDVRRLFEFEFSLEAFDISGLSELAMTIFRERYGAGVAEGVEE